MSFTRTSGVSIFRKALIVFALLAVSLVVSLTLAELLLRVFYPQKMYAFQKNMFSNSDEFGYYLTPKLESTHSQPDYSYTVKSNTFGFRGKEPRFDAPYRVLVLGDSMSMGQGVSDGSTLCDFAQKYFDDNRAGVDIFNTSISGYAGINEVGVLRKFATEYKPHLVVLMFCWNDVGVTKSLFVNDGYLVLHVGNPKTAKLREWANTHLHLYCLVKKVWFTRFKKPMDQPLNGKIPNTAMDTALNFIYEMKGICDRQNAQFVVVVLPFTGNGEGADAAEFNRDRSYMESKLADKSIAYKDWTDELPQGDRKWMCFKTDLHWNTDGNRYFSESLIRMIDEAKRDPKAR